MTRMQRLMIVVAGFGLVGSTGLGFASINENPDQCRDTGPWAKYADTDFWHDCTPGELADFPHERFSTSTIEIRSAGKDYTGAVRAFLTGMLASLLVVAAIASFGWVHAGKSP